MNATLPAGAVRIRDFIIVVIDLYSRSRASASGLAPEVLHQSLEYKGEIRGVEVLKENEWNTSKTCSRCGDGTKSNRVERGLYVCSSCELVANADCNGAENMRQKITPSPHGEDRSNGCVAQPSVHLFNRESGTFTTRERVVS